MERTRSKIPYLNINAGPNDPDWVDRLKEEYLTLIQYIRDNKEQDNDWVEVKALDKKGLKWEGKCWTFYEMVKYEFKLEFEIPATYPLTPIELKLPELDGKTEKMYHGGKICQDIHFAPLWAKESPKLGIAHALSLALGPWISVEIPNMIYQGRIQRKH